MQWSACWSSRPQNLTTTPLYLSGLLAGFDFLQMSIIMLHRLVLNLGPSVLVKPASMVYYGTKAHTWTQNCAADISVPDPCP